MSFSSKGADNPIIPNDPIIALFSTNYRIDKKINNIINMHFINFFMYLAVIYS